MIVVIKAASQKKKNGYLIFLKKHTNNK